MGLRLSWEKKKKRKHKLVQTIGSASKSTEKERVLNQIAQLRRLGELAASQGNEKKVQEYRQRLKDLKESLK